MKLEIVKPFIAAELIHSNGHTYVLAADPVEFLHYVRNEYSAQTAAKELCENTEPADRFTRLRQAAFLGDTADKLRSQLSSQ